MLDPQFKSWQPTREVGCVVDVSCPLVRCNLRIRAKRARPINQTVGGMRRENLIRWLTLFDPSFERAHHVERIRSLASAAMPHSRGHEQSKRCLHLGCANGLNDSGVVLSAVSR